MHGFLNLNKPPGLTSHDCVARVRRLLGTRQVGHAGTLDPAATGVLPLAVGRATRLLRFLPSDKAYRATIRLGVATTTDDLEGSQLPCASAAHLTLAQVEAVLPSFQGTLQQVPPQYSAIQVQGKRLYDLARAGQTVEVSPRTVNVQRLTVLGWRPGPLPELDLDIDCGPGTYIRSIARDLGHRLGTGGTLAHLQRTRSSGFTLATSLTFEQLAATEDCLLPVEKGLSHLTAISLEFDAARRWAWGQIIALPPATVAAEVVPDGTPLRVHEANGSFLGIAELREGQLKPIVVTAQPPVPSEEI
ncbi:tRNA pseudouridine(55) synthase TruB [Leptolyngbya sp. FACHB-261]|uniref:tRNA pseudouridine(55) synthase TruB n=1 Tax=Leptolyngbya sp. FACHB-261 TaxID=2692806 RepID=UPI0028C44105|nr:tRNA pseudouridine(55) synthase TruB [Leptolyngbya sp. FACHB-261]